ncbi:MAG: phosphotransferase [Pseudomonadota bacterium]
MRRDEEQNLVSEQQSNNVGTDDRLVALTRWVQALPSFEAATLESASDDASFRRYFRVRSGDQTWIAMDAPPPMEDCRPFVQVAGFLQAMAVNAPTIDAADVERGFLLMADFGDVTLLEAITRDPERIETLYADAIDTLARMQTHGAEFQGRLPPYDLALLQRELDLFRDWLCDRHLGITFSKTEDSSWQQVCEQLIDNALAQPRVFVHRDYHSRNLMLTETDNPGVIDFQDAVEGPLTYDLVSLLRDCYFRLESERLDAFARRYYLEMRGAMTKDIGPDEFTQHLDLTGLQRHLKAAGIFARLLHRDGKSRYMADVPTALRYVLDVAPRYPALSPLADFIRDRCLPPLEAEA